MALETNAQAEEIESLRLLLDPQQVLPPNVKEKDVLHVWYYLKYPNEITQDMAWPFASVVLLAPYLDPKITQLKTPIPLALVSFLAVDLRKYSIDKRVQHASFCISGQLPFPSFWMSVLHGLLVKFTRCREMSAADRGAPSKSMYHLIECNVRGTDLESSEVESDGAGK
ncbi:hypothetical protein BWQ96_05846 [Gracilariopsis chorda]|uniref:Uncharacterized protein n=1 Tax=Gracilariopsis chorda TaxID=448386 RepID=A0A2V3IQP0_9FLOR|nr:hypothetical protein BWQ96_05846 [Gracilariopsis chorda]|eukprot:PXF44403.1 hypothetical protein BWQ96_05846 [Gracilariopsis chorda]